MREKNGFLSFTSDSVALKITTYLSVENFKSHHSYWSVLSQTSPNEIQYDIIITIIILGADTIIAIILPFLTC